MCDDRVRKPRLRCHHSLFHRRPPNSSENTKTLSLKGPQCLLCTSCETHLATEMSRLATDPGSVWTRTGSWFPSDGLLKSVNHFSVQSMIQTSSLSLESASGLGVFSTSNGALVLALHQHTNMLMVHDGAIWNLVVVPRLQGGCYSILLNLDINLIEWFSEKKVPHNQWFIIMFAIHINI